MSKIKKYREERLLKVLDMINESDTIEEAVDSIRKYCRTQDDMAFLDKYYTGVGRWDRKILFDSGHKFNLGRYLNNSYFVQKKLKSIL